MYRMDTKKQTGFKVSITFRGVPIAAKDDDEVDFGSFGYCTLGEIKILISHFEDFLDTEFCKFLTERKKAVGKGTEAFAESWVKGEPNGEKGEPTGLLCQPD